MITKLALGVSGLVYLFFAYEYIFNLAHLFNLFGFTLPSLEGTTGGIITVMSRYLGIACFIFAFIFLHMIPHPEKASAALRTSTMVTGMYAGAAGYRAFVESGVSVAAIEATKKNFYIQAALLLLNVYALSTVPKEKGKKA